jgi:tetratricopeptide (TPR) repeat protein
LQKNDCRDEARRDYTRALEIDPKCLDAYTGLAGLYAKSQDFERAIATYQRGIKQIPNSPLLWYEEGIVACQRKDFPDALKCLGKAHQLDPENHLFGAQYGLLLARTGQPQEAVTVLSRVMNKAEANYNVARMMDHLNDSEKARQYCTVALQERPTHEGAIHLQAKLDGPRGGTLGAPEWEGQGDSDVRPAASWTTSQ